MPRWKNKGSLHSRPDGTTIKHGEVFEADEKEVAAFKDKFEKTSESVTSSTARRLPRSASGLDAEDRAAQEDGYSAAREAENETKKDLSDKERQTPETSVYAEGGQTGGGPADGDEELPEWTLRMSPARYLELHPDGPNAELAQQYVDAGEGGEEEDE